MGNGIIVQGEKGGESRRISDCIEWGYQILADQVE